MNWPRSSVSQLSDVKKSLLMQVRLVLRRLQSYVYLKNRYYIDR